MSSENYNAALADIKTSVARAEPHLAKQSGRIQMTGFGSGLALVLLKIFLDALSDEAKKQAAQAGLDVVRWIAGRIRAYLKGTPEPKGEMSIMPYRPAGSEPEQAEAQLSAALAEFLPQSEADALAKSVRAAVETRLS